MTQDNFSVHSHVMCEPYRLEGVMLATVKNFDSRDKKSFTFSVAEALARD